MQRTFYIHREGEVAPAFGPACYAQPQWQPDDARACLDPGICKLFQQQGSACSRGCNTPGTCLDLLLLNSGPWLQLLVVLTRRMLLCLLLLLVLLLLHKLSALLLWLQLWLWLSVLLMLPLHVEATCLLCIAPMCASRHRAALKLLHFRQTSLHRNAWDQHKQHKMVNVQRGVDDM